MPCSNVYEEARKDLRPRYFLCVCYLAINEVVDKRMAGDKEEGWW
jgi:hypothetical protein